MPPAAPPTMKLSLKPVAALRCNRSPPSLFLASSMAAMLFLVAAFAPLVNAHGYMESPRSRNWVAYEDGKWWPVTENDPLPEPCPHCLNLGGTLARCGLTGGRNYDSPQNALNGPMPPNVQASYTTGQEIIIDVALTTHHKGHFEFKGCPIEPGEVPTQECFDAHPLIFVEDMLYGAPVDSNYPERAYLAPMSHTLEPIDDPTFLAGPGSPEMRFSHKFRLPCSLQGSLVLIQWHYLTANSCKFPGYESYDWPTSWGDVVAHDPCGELPPDGKGVPEQFFNCAEASIISDPGVQCQDPPIPTRSPTTKAEPTTTIGNTLSPVESPTSPVPSPASPSFTKAPTVHGKTIIGYYASWQWYDRFGLAKPSNMDFTKVQRVNFAFFQTDVDGNLWGTDGWADPNVLFGPYDWLAPDDAHKYCHWVIKNRKNCGAHHYDQGLISLAHAAGAEIYPSIGGWSLSDPFPEMAASPVARSNFANKCVELIQDYDFDGIDLDWEYPGYAPHSGTPADTVNFNLLLDEVRAKLDALGESTGRFYGLTAALPCGPSIIDNIDIAHAANVLTELNLMTYDFHGSWNEETGVNAPLYDQEGGNADFSVHGCVNNWLEGGASRSKINIGLPFYGRSFKGPATGLNQPHLGTDEGSWHKDEGVPQYFSIVGKLSNMTSIRDETTKTQYAYFNTEEEDEMGFVSYDDERAICDKTEYAIENDLNGYIIWELSGDVMEDLSTPLLDMVNLKLENPGTTCEEGTFATRSPTTEPPTTSNQSTSSSSSCEGDPCPLRDDGLEVCRSQHGYCGMGIHYCNDDSTWKQFSCLASDSTPTKAPTAKVLSRAPVVIPTREPTFAPTIAPTPQVQDAATPIPSRSPVTHSPSAKTAVEDVLEAAREGLDNRILVYKTTDQPPNWVPSSIYRFDGFLQGLRVMHTDGVAGKHFYLGNDGDGPEYGLANIAAFLAQSMKETIQYDACDENSWDIVNGAYPLSNACGQLGQSYQDYHCSPEEAHMECPVDPEMEITATTNAKWYGAPAPLFCGPKSKYPYTGTWDYSFICHNPWNNPPEYCSDYPGQLAGRFDNSSPFPNTNGRTDVEGCCWWGRGVIQTTGVCNFGRLNYFLGKRAADEGRPSRYPTVDFCKDPGAICASEEFQELKWIAGMFYWIDSVQTYDRGGWNYMSQLRAFVDGGMTDYSFINAVSGIVNRGCHNAQCGTGELDGGEERLANFKRVLDEFFDESGNPVTANTDYGSEPALTPAPTETQDEPLPTPASNADVVVGSPCSKHVAFNDCSKYHICLNGQVTDMSTDCPATLMFDEETGLCLPESGVECSSTKAPTDAPTKVPTKVPTRAPTDAPSRIPTKKPSLHPTHAPSTHPPTPGPTPAPPIDGGWSNIVWDSCNVKCGGGTQSGSRTCSNPPPSGGGAACEGSATVERECNTHKCPLPVDGAWSEWSGWGVCSMSCGGGLQTRTRTCTNPSPANGGADCYGETDESRSCNSDACLHKFYPDHSTGKCVADGNHPSWMTGPYLYDAKSDCCFANFSWKMEECMGQTASAVPTKAPTLLVAQETPTKAPSDPVEEQDNLFYPNYGTSECVADGNQPSWMTGPFLFGTKSDCCFSYFSWKMDDCVGASPATATTTATIAAAPSTSSYQLKSMFYPDWGSYTCKSDGQQPGWMTEGYLFNTPSECCGAYFSWLFDPCLQQSEPVKTLLSTQQQTTETQTTSTVAPGESVALGNSFYPDFTSSVCAADGNQPSWMTGAYLFDSKSACCFAYFSWQLVACMDA